MLCFNLFILLFLATPCLIVVVQPCMEWIPIKKKRKKNQPDITKNITSFLMPSLTPLNQQNVKYPFPGNPPPLYIGFSWPPLKVRFFQWTPKILKFLSLNTILSFKVTKILVKISQFESLVMTEKNIFAHKHFLSLNISDFIFYVKIANCPPEKKSPPLSQQPPSKSGGPVKSPFLKIWLEFQPPPSPQQKGGRGGCTLWPE